MTKKTMRTQLKGSRNPGPVDGVGKVLAARKEYVQEFRELGFTEYEAKAYLTLCQASPATAYEVSKIAGLPKANVYAALEGLARRGAVQPVSEDPVTYVPIDPSRLLGQISKITSARCKVLSDKLSRMERRDDIAYVWTIRGDDDIHVKIDEMIDRARHHVWIKAPEELLERHIVTLRRASKRGVSTLLVLFGSQESVNRFSFGPRSQVYLHEGTGRIIGPARELVTLATDFQETLMAHTGEHGHGAFTKSSPVVYMAESLIRHELYLAEIFLKFGLQIEEQFGPALINLRERYLPTEHVRNLKENLVARSKRA